MSLDDVVNIQITRDAPAVTRAGFGTLLILGPNASGWGGDRVRSYTKPDDMLSDGFISSNPEYIAAKAAVGQDLRSPKFFVGLKLAAVAQVETVTPTAVNSFLYSITINDVEYTYMSDSSATAGEIALGLIAAINGGSEPVTASGTVTVILIADVAGVSFTTTLGTNLTGVATTPSHGVPEDLATIRTINDDWYGLVITDRADEVIIETAGYIEGTRKIFAACNSTAGVLTSGTTDVAYILKAKAYDRTFYLYSGNQAAFPEAAWLGGQLPEVPGSNTYKFKTLKGITVDNLTSAQRGFAKGKNANVYTSVGGSGMTEDGVVASGEFIDVIIGIDWIQVNMQADVFQIFKNTKKVPYTDAGIASLETAVRNRLRLAVLAGILAENPAPDVFAPLVANVDPADRAARAFNDMTFSAELAGAVHSTIIRGTVSV